MACHEIAALRLSLHTVLGDRPAHERTHELAELGPLIEAGGALQALSEATSLSGARSALSAAALELETRVTGLPLTDPSLGYHRALLVNVRSVQRSLDRIADDLARFYTDIEDVHDLMHEVFPGSEGDGDEHDHDHGHSHDHGGAS